MIGGSWIDEKRDGFWGGKGFFGLMKCSERFRSFFYFKKLDRSTD